MIEDALEQRLFLAKGREMGRLVCGVDVAASLVLALEPFVGNEPFERRDRLDRRVEQGPGAELAIARDQRRGVELQAGKHLAAVARAGAPADAFALEHDDRRARARQLPGRGQPGIARADDRHIDARGQCRLR